MRKWTRTKKLLAVVLSAAMVLTLNTAAFATDAAEQKITIQDDGSALIENTTNPANWSTASSNDAAALAAILEGGVNDHLVNGGKKTISEDGGGYTSLSVNIYPVTGADNYFLVLGYGSLLVKDGDYAFNGGIYDGRKVGFEGKGSTASKKGSLEAELALIKWDEASKKVTEINGVTIGDIKVKGNGKDANLSANGVEDKDGHFLGYEKTGELYTATIKPNVKFAKGVEVDKAVKGGVKKTLKDKTFGVGIRRAEVKICYADYIAGEGTEKVSENKVYYSDKNIHLSVGGSQATIKKVSAKSGKVTLTRSFNVKGKDVEKAIGKKDFTSSKQTVGDESIVVIDEFDSKNYEYELLNGKYKFAIREKGKNYYTGGIYAASDDCYIDSVE